jgi:hypothetical protein
MKTKIVFGLTVAAFVSGCATREIVGWSPTRPGLKPQMETQASCRMMAAQAQQMANIGYAAQQQAGYGPGVPQGSFASQFIGAGQMRERDDAGGRAFSDCMMVNGYEPIIRETKGIW